MFRISQLTLLSLFALALFAIQSISAQESGDSAKASKKLEKIPVEEIVERHLASIGPSEALSKIKSRVMIGEGKLVSKLGSPFTLNGAAQFASEGSKIVFAMAFENEVYPYEKAAFDGKEQSFGLPSGKTTVLAAYLRSQDSILKDGLFGGTLSSAWAITNLQALGKPKLEYEGTAEIEGRSCYKLKFSSKRTGDLRIMVYFDGETFRHVRTTYEYTIQPRIGTSSTDVRSRSRTERFSLQEDFKDFRKADQLTLPFEYSINVINETQIESRTGTISREWTLKIDTVQYDQAIESGVFKVS